MDEIILPAKTCSKCTQGMNRKWYSCPWCDTEEIDRTGLTREKLIWLINEIALICESAGFQGIVGHIRDAINNPNRIMKPTEMIL